MIVYVNKYEWSAIAKSSPSNTMYLGYFSWLEDRIRYLWTRNEGENQHEKKINDLTPLKVVPISIAITRERVWPP